MERVDEFTVEDRLVTDVGGTIGVRVLSTPGMIAMMERCSSILSFENLPDGQATVGFEVCVKHVAAAAEGAACTVRASLREVAAAVVFLASEESSYVTGECLGVSGGMGMVG